MFSGIAITDHALDGWQTRVGPAINLKNELGYEPATDREKLSAMKNILGSRLTGYLKEPDRIEFRPDSQCFILDNEIVGAYAVDEIRNYLVIVTFTGRVSECMALRNLDSLHSYIRGQRFKNRSFHTKEGITLPLSEEALAKQNFPIFNPTTTIKVESVEFKMTKTDENKYTIKPMFRDGRRASQVQFDVDRIGSSVINAFRQLNTIPLQRWGTVSDHLLAFHRELQEAKIEDSAVV
jgi:hypothetical protein